MVSLVVEQSQAVTAGEEEATVDISYIHCQHLHMDQGTGESSAFSLSLPGEGFAIPMG